MKNKLFLLIIFLLVVNQVIAHTGTCKVVYEIESIEEVIDEEQLKIYKILLITGIIIAVIIIIIIMIVVLFSYKRKEEE